jgi:hypothetical protein
MNWKRATEDAPEEQCPGSESKHARQPKAAAFFCLQAIVHETGCGQSEIRSKKHADIFFMGTATCSKGAYKVMCGAENTFHRAGNHQ